jgi:hypothetical protein
MRRLRICGDASVVCGEAGVLVIGVWARHRPLSTGEVDEA